jgi:hypothetical protein
MEDAKGDRFLSWQVRGRAVAALRPALLRPEDNGFVLLEKGVLVLA